MSSGAALAKVAVAVVVVGAAGGGAAEVVKRRGRQARAVAETRKAPERPAARKAPALRVARARGGGLVERGLLRERVVGEREGVVGQGLVRVLRVGLVRQRLVGFLRLGFVRLG